MNIKELKLKTFITRMGNKSKHIRHFIDYIPKEYNTYIEPFVGSGALFLYLKPKKWIINDINENLMNIWILIKNDPNYLMKKIKLFKNLFLSLKNRDEELLFLKKKVNDLNKIYDINTDNSILWLILNKISYMGSLNIYKNKYIISSINKNKNNIVPFMNGNWYLELIKKISFFINNTKGNIYNIDYKEILKKAKKNDFIFLDPPYMGFGKTTYDYNFNYKSSLDFLNELCGEVKKLDKKGVNWMMTQENTKEVRDTFKEYNIRKYKVYRILSKKYVYELFITNY